MTIKLITRGEDLDNCEYEGKCYHCKSTVTACPSDGTRGSSQRDGMWFTIKCPVCQKRITIDIGHENKVG
jgi:Fe-S-cluster-containing hydrogenase component 2